MARRVCIAEFPGSRGLYDHSQRGDQLSNLAGGPAEMTFKVPNPLYFP